MLIAHEMLAYICMYTYVYIYMRWKQTLVFGSVSYHHTSVISTSGNDGRWGHTGLTGFHIVVYVSSLCKSPRNVNSFFSHGVCSLCPWHTCEFSANCLRKAGKDETFRNKGNADFCRWWKSTSASVHPPTAADSCPYQGWLQASVIFRKLCLWGAH